MLILATILRVDHNKAGREHSKSGGRLEKDRSSGDLCIIPEYFVVLFCLLQKETHKVTGNYFIFCCPLTGNHLISFTLFKFQILQ